MAAPGHAHSHFLEDVMSFNRRSVLKLSAAGMAAPMILIVTPEASGTACG